LPRPRKRRREKRGALLAVRTKRDWKKQRTRLLRRKREIANATATRERQSD
jgi:hypothetical protein